MVSFTHAYPTSYWLHFHLWTGVSFPLLLGLASPLCVSGADDESVRQVNGSGSVKTGAILKRCNDAYTDTTMRVKGWKGRRSDHSCSESDNRVSVLSCLSVWLPASQRPPLLSCSVSKKNQNALVLWIPGSSVFFCLSHNDQSDELLRFLLLAVWIKSVRWAQWPSGGLNFTF